MKRAELESLILEAYNVQPDFPWLKYPNYEVFRHNDSKKWLALIMNVPKSKLGLQGSGTLDVVNFKCDALLIGSLRCEAGFFPAYHMNKDRWITVALDGSAPDEKIKMLLNESYEATASKPRHKRH
ncbi:MmcQ/YjbR family DNA-binding protein [Candidatus Allofournierella merdipullorum]|uniref:MmcQ/YjbR family DNA-binding protein n=1 Tax=Candidatus Allofournierella merdipullorum TaxID=2838595 RepID=UPI002A87DBA6|nr:MmcQ/YjbR family DNA-binding protein [Candidatus Fournierella merdipullorum]